MSPSESGLSGATQAETLTSYRRVACSGNEGRKGDEKREKMKERMGGKEN